MTLEGSFGAFGLWVESASARRPLSCPAGLVVQSAILVLKVSPETVLRQANRANVGSTSRIRYVAHDAKKPVLVYCLNTAELHETEKDISTMPAEAGMEQVRKNIRTANQLFVDEIGQAEGCAR